MDIYLPVANLSVNMLVIILLGGGVGILSGMFGVGGGFLTTPLLIFYGIPPTVAAASAATQVTGASVSGVFTHIDKGSVDLRMGLVLVLGGFIGAFIGAGVFSLLESWGQIDTVIGLLYVILLSGVGTVMGSEAIGAIRTRKQGLTAPPRRHRRHPIVTSLPLRWRFYRSNLYISPLAPLLLGIAVGVLTMLLGVGGGFIMVPVMLYLFGMGSQIVVGTSLFQILFVTIAATMVHSLTTRAVDIVLAALLLFGSVIGAQLGTRLAHKLSPEKLRLALALIVWLVAARLAMGLGFQPNEIYTIQ